MTVIAATGHRPAKLGGYSDTILAVLVALARHYLSIHPVDKAISGMALGWDTAWAIAATELGVPLIAAVPFKGQESAWRGRERKRYRHLISRAERVHIVCEGGYAAWKMQTRNQWMVDNCDRLCALWDGTSGGTGNCIAYAIRVGRPFDNLYNAADFE